MVSGLGRVVQQAGTILMDWVYPRQCAHCGRTADATRFLCWNCLAEIQYIHSPYCSCCGDPVPGRIDHEYRCAYCSRQTPHFVEARSAVRYRGPVGMSLRAIKYESATWLVPEMTRLLLACMQTHYDLLPVDAVCYVPLHAVKRRERGFNQAQLLAKALCRERSLSLCRGGLRRVLDRGSQTRLTAAEREANVAGVFTVPVPARVQGRRLLLVDDVMTTGATVNECARVLKRAGANSVHVLTVARG